MVKSVWVFCDCEPEPGSVPPGPPNQHPLWAKWCKAARGQDKEQLTLKAEAPPQGEGEGGIQLTSSNGLTKSSAISQCHQAEDRLEPWGRGTTGGGGGPTQQGRECRLSTPWDDHEPISGWGRENEGEKWWAGRKGFKEGGREGVLLGVQVEKRGEINNEQFVLASLAQSVSASNKQCPSMLCSRGFLQRWPATGSPQP